MYEELVDEFEFKKSASNILEVKDQKISTLTMEVAKLKSNMILLVLVESAKLLLSLPTKKKAKMPTEILFIKTIWFR